MPHLSLSAVGTQIHKATNPLRTNRKAPAVQNILATLQTIAPVAPRQIHICPRHSQLSVIAHAIACDCIRVHIFSLLLRGSLVSFLLFPCVSFPSPIQQSK